MITCYLQGGLGNLMFQIAATYSLALDNNDNCCFDFSNGWYNHEHINTYLDNIFSKVKYGKFPIQNKYNEKNYSYDKILYQDNLCLKGYFQSEKYFKHNRKHILDLFKLNKKFDFLSDKNTVSLHIRRGDYLKLQDHHPVCDLDYYKKALLEFNDDEYTFVVISEDIEWCKENFDGNFIYIEGQTDYEDLWLMSLCDNNIIANSTFSWWGAWLNQNPNKKVIAPKQWFGSALSHNTNDLYPPEWITL